MRRDRGERFEVHREAVGRALDPELRLLLIRQRVIRRVVLHEWKALRVVPQALVGLLRDVVGIPAGLQKSWIRPRAGADQHLLAHNESVRLWADRLRRERHSSSERLRPAGPYKTRAVTGGPA